MATLGRLHVDLIANTQAFQKGLAGAQKSFQSVGRSMANVGKSLSAGVTLPIVGVGVAAFKMAADSAEAASKMQAVFGGATQDLNAWIADLRDTIPETTASLQGMTSGIGDLLVPLGIAPDKAQDMTKSVVKLAGDLASFNNIPMAEALERIRSGLVGQNEPLLNFGVAIDAAGVKARALSMGLIQQGEDLDAASRAQAAFVLIVEGTTAAQGDAAKTAASAANQLKFLWSETKEAAAVLGTELLPVITPLITKAADFAENVSKLTDSQKKMVVVTAAAVAALGPFLIVLGSMTGGFGSLLVVATKIPAAITAIKVAVLAANPVTLAIVAAIGVLTAAFVLLDSEGRAKVLGALKKMADKFKAFTAPIANMVKAVGRMTLQFIGLWLEVQATVLAIVEAIATGIWDWFVEWLAPLGQWLWDKVLEPFIGVLAMVANKISGWAGKVTGLFRRFRSKVTGEEVEPMAEQVQNLFSGMKDTVTNTVTGMKDTVTNTVTGMARAVVGAVKGMGTDVVPPVQQMRLAVVGEVIQMGVAVQPLMEKMKANVTVPLIDAGTQAQMSMTAMKDAIAGPGGILSEFGGDTGKRVQAIVSNVTGKWGALRGVLERGDFDVSGFTALKESGLKILGGLLSKAGGIAKKLFGLFKGGGGLFGKIGGLFKGGLGKIGGAVLSGLGSVGSAAAGVLSAVAPVLSAAVPVLAIAGAGYLGFKGIKALTGAGASQRFTEEEKRQLGESNAAIAGRRGEAEGLGLIRPLWTAADAKDLGGVGGEVGRLGLGLTPAFEATNQAVSRIIDGQARTDSRLDDVSVHIAHAVSVLERIAGHTERFTSQIRRVRERIDPGYYDGRIHGGSEQPLDVIVNINVDSLDSEFGLAQRRTERVVGGRGGDYGK